MVAKWSNPTFLISDYFDNRRYNHKLLRAAESRHRVRTRDQQDDGGGIVVATKQKRKNPFCNMSDFYPMQIKNLIMLVRVKLVTSLTTWRCAACNLQLFIKHQTELLLVYYSHKKLLKLLPVMFQTNLPSDGPSLNN